MDIELTVIGATQKSFEKLARGQGNAAPQPLPEFREGSKQVHSNYEQQHFSNGRLERAKGFGIAATDQRLQASARYWRSKRARW